MSSSFAERFQRARQVHGPLVWGVDPAGTTLDSWGLGDSPDGLDRFVDIVLDVAVDSVGLIKPQSAFYERHGWRGIRSLTRLVANARERGLLVVLDAKRGDVGSTNDAYAEAYLGKGAPIEVDALTVHPYLGIDAMTSLIDRAQQSGSCLLIVTRSTNPGGRQIQEAVAHEGASVEAAILAQIGQLNTALSAAELGPIGAVVGLSTHKQPLEFRDARALFLVPGVGAQGTTPQEVAEAFSLCPDRVMPSASRSLLAAGPDPAALRAAIRELADEFRRLLAT